MAVRRHHLLHWTPPVIIISLHIIHQTGSGKTHTMEGGVDRTDAEACGMIPRAVFTLFDALDAEDIVDYDMQVSHLEIYNEQLRDLLIEDPFLRLLTTQSQSQRHAAATQSASPTASGNVTTNDVPNAFFGTRQHRAAAAGIAGTAPSRSGRGVAPAAAAHAQNGPSGLRVEEDSLHAMHVRGLSSIAVHSAEEIFEVTGN